MENKHCWYVSNVCFDTHMCIYVVYKQVLRGLSKMFWFRCISYFLHRFQLKIRKKKKNTKNLLKLKLNSCKNTRMAYIVTIGLFGDEFKPRYCNPCRLPATTQITPSLLQSDLEDKTLLLSLWKFARAQQQVESHFQM